MDKRAQIVDKLRGLNPAAPFQVWPATVKSVDGLTCTVNLLNTGLVGDAAVGGVKLRANDEMKEGVLVVPRKDSFVFVASVENSMDTLFVCYVSEVDRVEAIIKKTKVVMDEYGITAEREKMKVLMTNNANEISATNDKASVTLRESAVVAEVDGKLKLSLMNGLARLEKETTVVELGSKVSIKNSGASLKELFSDLTTLLQSFQVLCAPPGAPSAPFPATVAKVVQLTTKVNLLLQ